MQQHLSCLWTGQLQTTSLTCWGMWQLPLASTVAAHLGAGWRFLPRQAAQGPMVAPVAWQLDVWS